MSDTKLTNMDFHPGQRVRVQLPSGTWDEATVKEPTSPFMVMEDGRKFRPGSCQHRDRRPHDPIEGHAPAQESDPILPTD